MVKLERYVGMDAQWVKADHVGMRNNPFMKLHKACAFRNRYTHAII